MRDLDKLEDELYKAVENGEMTRREANEIWAEAKAEQATPEAHK